VRKNRGAYSLDNAFLNLDRPLGPGSPSGSLAGAGGGSRQDWFDTWSRTKAFSDVFRDAGADASGLRESVAYFARQPCVGPQHNNVVRPPSARTLLPYQNDGAVVGDSSTNMPPEIYLETRNAAAITSTDVCTERCFVVMRTVPYSLYVHTNKGTREDLQRSSVVALGDVGLRTIRRCSAEEWGNGDGCVLEIEDGGPRHRICYDAS
jgi:hypothetical protein